MLKTFAFVLPLAIANFAQAEQPSVVCSGAYHHEIVKGDAARPDDSCAFRCWFDDEARYCETIVGKCAAPKPKTWAYLGGKYGVMSFFDFRSVPCKVSGK